MTGAMVRSDGTIQTQAASMGTPSWLFGTEGAERWLYAPRGTVEVRVVDLSDPFDGERADRDGGVIVDAGGQLIAELLWAMTDATAPYLALVVPGRRLVFSATRAGVCFEELAPVLDDADPARTALVWGEGARADDATVRVGFRLPGEGADHAVEGTVQVVAARLAAALEGAGLCRATELPAWYRPPAPERLADWCRLIDAVHLQVLADPYNGLIEPMEDPFHAQLVADARAAADRSEGGVAGCRWDLLAGVAAVYAHRAGVLDDGARDEAIDALLAAGPGHVLHRIAPALLAGLDEPVAARVRRDELLRTASGPLLAWLEGLGGG